MLRKRTGSVVCPSCGRLVGVNAERCPNCGRARPGMFGFLPLVKLGHDFGFTGAVIAGCVALYLISLLLSGGAVRVGGWSLIAPSGGALLRLGAAGALPVFALDRWWTVLSAAWLHGGVLHILFNMMWVRSLAPAVGHGFGAARMVIIYTVSSITGFGLSSFLGYYAPFLPRLGAGLSVGASAPIFGLLGALLLYGRRRGASEIGSQALSYAIILGVFGFVMAGVDNAAHLGGFAGGFLAARWLDPWKEERPEHVIAAFACLFLVLASLVASLLVPLPDVPGLG